MAALVLYVSVNPNGNPQVIISDRAPDANGRRVEWRKSPGANPDFKFARLDELDQENFHQQSIDTGRKKARCNNRAPISPPNNLQKYEYTLVAKSLDGTQSYTSTISGNPPGDKPVIRN